MDEPKLSQQIKDILTNQDNESASKCITIDEYNLDCVVTDILKAVEDELYRVLE